MVLLVERQHYIDTSDITWVAQQAHIFMIDNVDYMAKVCGQLSNLKIEARSDFQNMWQSSPDQGS